jgi:hypothetical protein
MRLTFLQRKIVRALSEGGTLQTLAPNGAIWLQPVGRPARIVPARTVNLMVDRGFLKWEWRGKSINAWVIKEPS